MANRISIYEELQVEKYLYDLYLLWGRNLEESMCISEGWIVYLDGKEKYRYDIGEAEYWQYVQENVKRRFAELRTVRNERIRLESRMSLNQTFGDAEEEIGVLVPAKTGDFVNSIALWDYAQRLGGIKYEVLKLMYAKEEDYDIMRILRLDREDYYEIKRELREDFERYLYEEWDEK